MGNCATKPKVIKDSDEDLIPVEQETSVRTDHNKDPAEKSQTNAPNAPDEATAAETRRSEKGKEILIEGDVDEHSKRQSLSHLFHEDKAIEKELTDLSPTKAETTNKKTSAMMASNVKVPETFEVQTRNDLEVKIPKDSKVKTPETPKAKEAEDHEVNFSENWEVKFPEELEATKPSQVVNPTEESKLPQVSKVSAPELSEVKVTKEPDVPEFLEDKNVQEVSKVKTDEVKAAKSELLTVSEVKTSEDLEIKVPKVFEAKNPETSKVKVGSKVKTDQEATKIKTAEERKFLDAQEKIDKSEAQILKDIKETDENVMHKTKKGEKDLSIDKRVKVSTLSGLDNK